MVENVRTTLITIISGILGKDVSSISGDAHPIHGLGMDSLQAVHLIASIEQRFGLVFGRDPEDMTALVSFDSLCRWVEDRV